MIVRWGLDALPAVLAELGIERPLLITTARWADLDLPVARRFADARSHAEVNGVRGALDALGDSDGLVALGGGSAIDTAKAVSSQTDGLPIVSIPTTYSGAEWTTVFGMRDAAAETKAGGGGANTAGIVYVPELTLDLPADQSAGTALNAFAHCAEALYAPDATEGSDAHALAGAALISRWLPVVIDAPHDLEARRGLLEGAAHAGAALRAGMGVGHAMAQTLGGRYGLPHGAMNAVVLPHALRFNADAAPEALVRLRDALDGADPADRAAALARLGNSDRLRDYDVPRDDLTALAEVAAARPPAQANPRPAPPEAILAMLEAAW
jgi:maleylacetate reductase